jgi:HAMP domain-containing protein/HD superfamily phosphodiesterase
MTKTDKEGVWQFIIDTKPVRGARKVKTALPGDKYDASRFPEMLKGFSSPSADKTLVADEWGNSLSGYAPIRDKLGKAVAVLGVDIMADDLYIIQKQVNRWVALILLFGVILSVALGMFISVKITSPVKKLVEGTRHIAAGNLQYQVEIRSADEIGELAKSFNNMAGSLYEARKKLREYFYGIVQSLVRTIEAKDRYTRGHSERVAEYAEKIAVGMGFSAEKAELLKEAAVLHDIGKLGIHEDILNKKEKLTDEEWEAIRKHPATGEDILKPVLGEEMLEAIKEHHERCDGTGYPNKLDADHISIFAKIIAVADTYDAMTSSRAYRAALSKKEAIVELKKGKGSQFDPQVVDVFVKVLEEET